MKILGISTSSNVASVCLSEDLDIIKELNINNNKTHSETLIPLVKQLLSDTNTELSSIKLLACDVGPGSFTGIRIGISSIKAIAQTLNIPIVSVSSLEALAYGINNTDYICSIIDARNNQVYSGIFDYNHCLLEDYFADDINKLLPIIKKYKDITFIGDGALLHTLILNSNNIFSDPLIHSRNINICAYNKYKNGTFQTADTILPMYLRKSQAERMKQLNG